jgi:hypothetical protein
MKIYKNCVIYMNIYNLNLKFSSKIFKLFAPSKWNPGPHKC